MGEIRMNARKLVAIIPKVILIQEGRSKADVDGDLRADKVLLRSRLWHITSATIPASTGL